LEAILKGGESGPAVVPGKPDESLIVEAINYEGLEMPPTGKLSPEKAAVLTRWVSLGAPWPSRDRAAHAAPLPAGSGGTKLSAADLAVAQPVRKPTIPVLAKHTDSNWADWSHNPIDRFILKSLFDHGLTPLPGRQADPDPSRDVRPHGVAPAPRRVDV
jgi:hypothetical protein